MSGLTGPLVEHSVLKLSSWGWKFHAIFSSQIQVVTIIEQIASQLNDFFKENKSKNFKNSIINVVESI